MNTTKTYSAKDIVNLLRMYKLPTELPTNDKPHKIILVNGAIQITITKLNSDTNEYSIRSGRGV